MLAVRHKTLGEYLTNLASKLNIERGAKILQTRLTLKGYSSSDIKKIATSINKLEVKEIISLLESTNFTIYEEQLLYVYIIKNLPYDNFRFYLLKLIPFIDTWAITDAIRFKSYQTNIDKLNNLILELFSTNKVYAIRSAFILRMYYFKSKEYLDVIFNEMLLFEKNNEYYIMMVISWLLQVLYLEYPNEVEVFIFKDISNNFIISKTISKINDSLKVNNDNKIKLKEKYQQVRSKRI